MIKKIIFGLLLIIILSSTSYADYTNIGGTEGSFRFDGQGNFNSDLEAFGTTPISVNSPGLTPFISDLDGDGIKEIIIFDLNAVEIYQGSDLTPVGSYVFLNLSTTLEPSALIFDIDGDGIKEIIASASNNPVIEIVEYNGTHTFLDNSFQKDGTNCYGATPDPIINCKGVNDCLLVTPQSELASLSAQRIRYCSFNSTGFMHRASEIQSYNSGEYACVGLSSIPKIEIADYDQDNENEYIFSFVNYLRSTSSGGGQVRMNFVDVNSSGHINLELSIQTVEEDYLGSEPGYLAYPCNRFSRFFTSPTTLNLDNSIFNGLETIVGFTDDEFTFIMETFDKTGTLLRRTPSKILGLEILDPGGELVSNIMKFKSFPKSRYDDYCVLGFDKTDQLLNLLCGSEDSGLSYFDEQTFEIPLSSFNPGFNISTTSRTYNRISHAGKHSQNLQDNANLDELVLSYGIFSLEYSGFQSEFLNLEFQNTFGDAAIISEDVENTGLDDLLILTETELLYIDDLLKNQQAFFNGNFQIDPCIEQPIKLNETMLIFAAASDEEGNDINFTAYVYYNDANQQVHNEIKTSGSTFITGLFQLNKTIVNGDIRLEVRDTQPENQANPDVLNFKFTVTSDGVLYQGGCVTTGFITGISPTDNSTIDDTTLTESDKEDLIEAILPSSVFPSKFRPIISILLIIAGIIGTLYALTSQNIIDSSVLIYIPLSVGFVLWILFVFLRMLPGWSIIVAIIFASAFLGMKFIPMRQGG